MYAHLTRNLSHTTNGGARPYRLTPVLLLLIRRAYPVRRGHPCGDRTHSSLTNSGAWTRPGSGHRLMAGADSSRPSTTAALEIVG